MVTVLELAYEFYTVEALMLVMQEQRPHVSIQNQVRGYRRKLHNAMRYLFRDYILVACFGEARHGLSQCYSYIPDLVVDRVPVKARTVAGNMAKDYTVESLQNGLKLLFDAKWKTSSFGGPRWGQAIKALDLWDNPVVFLDHVFDLRHNGSSLFNKNDYEIVETGSLDKLTTYLNDRFEKSSEELIKYYYYVHGTKELYELIAKATKGPKVTKYKYNNLKELFDYKPIEFGTKILSSPVAVDKTMGSCGECGATYVKMGHEHYCPKCLKSEYTHCIECEAVFKGVSVESLQEQKQHEQKQAKVKAKPELQFTDASSTEYTINTNWKETIEQFNKEAIKHYSNGYKTKSKNLNDALETKAKLQAELEKKYGTWETKDESSKPNTQAPTWNLGNAGGVPLIIPKKPTVDTAAALEGFSTAIGKAFGVPSELLKTNSVGVPHTGDSSTDKERTKSDSAPMP